MQRISTRHTMLAVGAVIGVLSGCSSDNGTGSDGGGTTGCTITLTGAQTGSPPCSGVTVIWTSDDNKFAFGFYTATGDTTVTGSLAAPGEPAKTTYQSTDATLLGSAVVDNGENGWLAQSADPSSDTPAVGSFTLTITSLSTMVSNSDGKVYTAHGTFTATLPASTDTGATGTVMMKVTF